MNKDILIIPGILVATGLIFLVVMLTMGYLNPEDSNMNGFSNSSAGVWLKELGIATLTAMKMIWKDLPTFPKIFTLIFVALLVAMSVTAYIWRDKGVERGAWVRQSRYLRSRR